MIAVFRYYTNSNTSGQTYPTRNAAMAAAPETAVVNRCWSVHTASSITVYECAVSEDGRYCREIRQADRLLRHEVTTAYPSHKIQIIS